MSFKIDAAEMEEQQLLRDLEAGKNKVESALTADTKRCIWFIEKKVTAGRELGHRDIKILLRTVCSLRQLACSISDTRNETLLQLKYMAKSVIGLTRRQGVPKASQLLLEKNLFKLLYSVASAFAKRNENHESLECLLVCKTLSEALKVYNMSGFWCFLGSTYEKLGQLANAKEVYKYLLTSRSCSEETEAQSLIQILHVENITSNTNTTSENPPVASREEGRESAIGIHESANSKRGCSNVIACGSGGDVGFDFPKIPRLPNFQKVNDARAECRHIAWSKSVSLRLRLRKSTFPQFNLMKFQLATIQIYVLASMPCAIPKVRQDVTAPEYWALADVSGRVMQTVMSPQSQAAIVSCNRVFASSSDSTLSIYHHNRNQPCFDSKEDSDFQSDEGRISRNSFGLRTCGANKRPPALSSELIGLPLVSLSQ